MCHSFGNIAHRDIIINFSFRAGIWTPYISLLTVQHSNHYTGANLIQSLAFLFELTEYNLSLSFWKLIAKHHGLLQQASAVQPAGWLQMVRQSSVNFCNFCKKVKKIGKSWLHIWQHEQKIQFQLLINLFEILKRTVLNSQLIQLIVFNKLHFSRTRDRKLEISIASTTKAKSQEPAYSQAWRLINIILSGLRCQKGWTALH